MTTFTIGLGETIVIPARTVEEHLHDLRRTRGLAATNHLKNGDKAKILRAYAKPPGQSCISIEVSDTQVKVIAMVLQHKDQDGNVLDPPLDVTERGYAVVDIIDEISEPWGDDHDIYVVRQPQLKAPATGHVTHSDPPGLGDGPNLVELARDASDEKVNKLFDQIEADNAGAPVKEAAPAAAKATAPAPIEVKADL
jgi:hypothetical protein